MKVHGEVTRGAENMEVWGRVAVEVAIGKWLIYG